MLDEERNKHQVYCTSKIFFKMDLYMEHVHVLTFFLKSGNDLHNMMYWLQFIFE